MRRTEFYKKAMSYTDCEKLALLLYALKPEDRLDALLSKASDNDINGALNRIGKEERLTGG